MTKYRTLRIFEASKLRRFLTKHNKNLGSNKRSNMIFWNAKKLWISSKKIHAPSHFLIGVIIHFLRKSEKGPLALYMPLKVYCPLGGGNQDFIRTPVFLSPPQISKNFACSCGEHNFVSCNKHKFCPGSPWMPPKKKILPPWAGCLMDLKNLILTCGTDKTWKGPDFWMWTWFLWKIATKIKKKFFCEGNISNFEK